VVIRGGKNGKYVRSGGGWERGKNPLPPRRRKIGEVLGKDFNLKKDSFEMYLEKGDGRFTPERERKGNRASWEKEIETD